jgi:hypothetical protein
MIIIIIMHIALDISMSMLLKTSSHVRGHAALRDLAHRTRGESQGRDGAPPATMRLRAWI